MDKLKVAIGSSLDDFLKEEGIYEECMNTAIKGGKEYIMKYKFGLIKDGMITDYISIIIFGFPIICCRRYYFPNCVHPENSTQTILLFILGFRCLMIERRF